MGELIFRTVTPNEMNAAESWLPLLFCGPAGRVARMAADSRRLGEVASTCMEGWRISSDPRSPLYDPMAERSPRYRMANIGVFGMEIEAQHGLRPVIENRPYCVLPGDVVVPRIPPLRACLVSESTHRHPIDGNCFLTRGMKPSDAALLLALLNEKEFESWLVARSGSQALPRIGLRDLRRCPFPDPPQGIHEWTTGVFDWVENVSLNTQRLLSLQSEVAAHVSGSLVDQDRQDRRLFPGVWEPATVLAVDSWVPGHVESEYRQRQLLEGGAVRLRDLLVNQSPAAARLKNGDESMVPLLKVADVSGIYLPAVEPSSSETRRGRFFAETVQRGEVLVSSLVSSPKITYGDPSLNEAIHPIDHWLRLTFKETPGAWALVLSSPAVKAQYQKLASGSARQFTTMGRMLELCVPNIDPGLRRRWQPRLDELLAERRRLDGAWKALRLEGRRMVAPLLGVPWSEMQTRSLR